MLLGAWLRAKGLFDNSFYTDEALFASWARLISTGRDPFLQAQLVDKPPLLFYMQVVAFRLLRSSEWAARLPNWIASVALIPLVYRWIVNWWRDCWAGLFAAAMVALSPFAIQFSGTAFTDPLMVTLVVGSLAQSTPNKRGLLFGLALATKYQAILLLPLVMWWRVDWRVVVGTMIGVAGWMWVSGQAFLGSGDALLIGGIRPITSYELLPRWQQWQNYLNTVFGIPILWVFIPCTIGIFLSCHSHPRRNSLLILWFNIVLYFCFHWLLATAVYDRYMLPMVVMMAALVGVGVGVTRIEGNADGRKRYIYVGLLFTVYCLLFTVGVGARNGGFAIGGQVDADEGSAEIAAYFADAPYGTVLYDHWYSWQWRYHLLETGVYTEWTPDPRTLVENLDVFYDAHRYLILPADARAAPFQRALRKGGYALEKRLQSDEMILYQIVRSK